MSATLLSEGFEIHGLKHLSTEYSEEDIILHAEMTTEELHCPKCSASCFKLRGKKTRCLQMVPLGSKRSFLHLILHRLECRNCGHLYWPVLSFMSGKKRMTTSFIRMVGELLAIGTIQDVAKLVGLGWDTVKRIHKDYLATKYEEIPLEDIEYISVDEFSIRKRHNYMTVVTNIKTGAVIHAVEGRKKEVLKAFFEQLKKKPPDSKLFVWT